MSTPARPPAPRIAPTAALAALLSRVEGDARRWEYRFDFITGVVRAQFKTEYAQYFLGWLWWILEPISMAFAFFFVVFLFFHLPGDRLWVIMVSIAAWRWFQRSVDQSPHLARQFNPYLRTGGVSLELLFIGFLVKEFVVFVIAMSVILVPTAIFSNTITWHLIEVPLILVAQALITYPVAVGAMIVGARLHDVGKLVGLVVTLWWYFSPGLYIRTDAQSIPSWILQLLSVNPFWTILTSWQNVLVRGEDAEITGLLLWTAVGAVGVVLATRALRRARRMIILESEA